MFAALQFMVVLALCLVVYGRFISPPSPLSPKGDQALSLSLKLGPRGALQVHSLAGGGSEFFLYVLIDYSGIIGE